MNFLSRLFVIFLVSSIGCGGSGDDSFSRVFSGTLRSFDDQPFENVRVSVADSGDETFTDTLGHFSILSASLAEDVLLNFESDSINASLVIDDIPMEAEGVVVEVVLSEDGDKVESSSVYVAMPESDLWVCTLEWDPVCGKDAQTYSNECSARSQGVEIDYQGECSSR